MPNHYHLLVQEVVDGGAVEFTKRLGNGYTKYFNIKNNRSGYLFQNAAKIVQVTSDPHFLYLPIYIDLNPLKLLEPKWKEEGIKNKSKALVFLQSYKWASVVDYLGKENYPFLINKDLFFDLFETDDKTYKKDLIEWLNDSSNKNR